MKIQDDWSIKDDPSGIRIEATKGKHLNCLHVASMDGRMNRDFFFTKKGKFDGTGSIIAR